MLDTDLGAFQKTVDVNIRGYFFMSVEAGKLMRENGGGSIINVASINGISPGVFQGIYSVTKAAVINMTKVFAKECAAVRYPLQRAVAGPDRHQVRLGTGQERLDPEHGAGRRFRSSVWLTPAKWPAQCCTWPAMRRATPLACR